MNVLVFLDLTVSRDILSAALSDNTRPDTATGDAMIKPDELESKAGQLTWNTIVAAAEGDVIALRQLLKQNPRLALSEYWYTPAIHFAVREGHI